MTGRPDVAVVGMGELQVTEDPDVVLACLGLGSCIALAFYDPSQKIAGLAHMVLPESSDRPGRQPAMYVDNGVPELLQQMEQKGARKSRLIARMAGGARMSIAPGLEGVFNTGDRNAAATEAALAASTISLKAADVGGHHGRSVRLSTETGTMTVSTAGGEAVEL